jgi:hypothetical protein
MLRVSRRFPLLFLFVTIVAVTAVVGACLGPGIAPDDIGDAGTAADSGAAPDSGEPVDAAIPLDGGQPEDAGLPGDAGEPLDAATPIDAGPSADAGAPVDAGERIDAGMPFDAGHPRDGGMDHPDAGGCDGGCPFSRLCCSGECINPANDPMNCGTCGTKCEGDTPYCNNTCMAAPCSPGARCDADGGACCGSSCCGTGELCCDSEGPVGNEPVCYMPTQDQPTCPQGCAPLCVSDRDAKRDVEPVDDRAVLESLMRVPVSTWSYKDDAHATRHLGPMAQDLHDAFGLGPTDKGYDPVDAHGVAFSSIRALYEIVRAQDARIQKLERENAALRARIEQRHR